MLALGFGVKKFHFYVYGCSFTLVTNHLPLQCIFGLKTGILAIAAARLQHWTVTLSAYRYNLLYNTSVKNMDADCLSRLLVFFTVEEQTDEDIFYTLWLDSMPVTRQEISRHTSHDSTLWLVFHTERLAVLLRQCRSQAIPPQTTLTNGSSGMPDV